MYVVTGASGNSGRVVAQRLLEAGQRVRAIGRSADRLQQLASAGAEPYVCDVTDRAALARALWRAEGVYVMMPQDPTSQNYRAYQDRVTESFAAALAEAEVQRVVTLSSVGADKAEKTGPIVGLHGMEKRLNQIAGPSVLHLRAGYFMENTLAQVGIIKELGVTAGPLRGELELAMIATRDIGNYAAEALLRCGFTNHTTRELLGQRDISMSEVAGIIGRSLGRPHLSYKQLPREQVRASLVEMKLSPNVADLILEMSDAFNSGHAAPLERRSAENTTPTSYEDFVNEELVPRFKGRSTAA
jgi:uncharacterized protein YbjT (DUF2867 family)